MKELPSHRLRQAKRRLRRRVLERRDDLIPSERVERSRSIAARLTTLPETVDARAVMAFWSFGSEVDTAPLIEGFLADGKTVALPRIEEGEVVPVEYTPGGEMSRTAFGSMEPRSGRVLDPRQLDLVVVPGVAFDRSCRRLGYGGGFYDRLLGRTRGDAPAVSIAFALQLVGEVPAGRIDRTVDAIVTEDEVIRCR